MQDYLNDFTRTAIKFLPSLLLGVLVLVGFWIVAFISSKVLRNLGNKYAGDRREVMRFFGQIAKGSLIALGIVSALGTVGVNVSALVAGLGLTGFALGFALRDVLSNLLAGLLIIIYRPFRPGDHILVSGFEGIVTEINLRYTSLQTEGKKILVPNSFLFTNAITITFPSSPNKLQPDPKE